MAFDKEYETFIRNAIIPAVAMFGQGPDNIPKLTEDQKKMQKLTIVDKGYVFCFNYGTLVLMYPE